MLPVPSACARTSPVSASVSTSRQVAPSGTGSRVASSLKIDQPWSVKRKAKRSTSLVA